MIYKVPEGMKMVSLRMTDKEVQRIDSRAAASNLSRTNYIRTRLKEEESANSPEQLVELLDLLRQLVIMLDSHQSTLERLEQKLENSDNGNALALIVEEIERSRDLTNLISKTQKHAVRVLRESRNVNGG